MPPVASRKQDKDQQEQPAPVSSAPVVPKKKVVKSKVEEVVTSEVVATPVVEVVPEVAVATSVVVPDAEKPKDDVVNDDDIIQNLVDKIASLSTLVKELQNAIKPVVKEHDRQKKIIEKIHKKRENAKKSPSGFAKPNKISNELCDFIGVPHGSEKSRTDITRYINSYVKENNLNKPSNRRVIIPDDKLKNILKINDGEEVTFFILQRLISHHFPPKQGTVVAPQ
jgi:chromatin remodeling complex protein RSC6